MKFHVLSIYSGVFSRSNMLGKDEEDQKSMQSGSPASHSA